MKISEKWLGKCYKKCYINIMKFSKNIRLDDRKESLEAKAKNRGIKLHKLLLIQKLLSH